MSAAGLSVKSETLHRIAAMGLHFRCDGITIVVIVYTGIPYYYPILKDSGFILTQENSVCMRRTFSLLLDIA